MLLIFIALTLSVCVNARSVVVDNHCRDPNWYCANNEKCLEVEKDNFKCCPYAWGRICDDRKSCCPAGLRCNSVEGQCMLTGNSLKEIGILTNAKQRRSVSTYVQEDIHNGEDTAVINKEFPDEDPLMQLIYSLAKKINKDQTCPNGKQKCDKFETCCKVKDGSYGCCDYFNATCCKDGVHCCPMSTTCDMEDNTCDHGNGAKSPMRRKRQADMVLTVPAVKVNEDRFTYSALPMLRKRPARRESGMRLRGRHYCGDSLDSCDNNETCCPLFMDIAYVCCSYKNATCCADHDHCCPAHMKCDLKSMTCHP